MKWLRQACVICLTTACSSASAPPPGGNGSGSVHGTLLGKTFTPVNAVSVIAGGAALVALSSAAGVCSSLANSGVAPNSAVLIITLPSAAAGTHGNVNVQFAEFDATCKSPAGESGSGTVDITASSANSLSGTFSLKLNSDSITGSFVAPACGPSSSGGGASACK